MASLLLLFFFSAAKGHDMLLENVKVKIIVDGEASSKLELACTTDSHLQDVLYALQDGHTRMGDECKLVVSYTVNQH